MTRYLVARVLAAIPVMLLVATGVFLLLFLTPGDPVATILGSDASPERVRELRTQLGLDDPLPLQLVRWLGRLLHGDLGSSIFLGRPVTQAIAERAEPTLLLTLLSTLFAVSLGVPMGLLAATRAGSWADVGAMLVGLAGVSMPTFWVGLNLIFVFAVALNWLPVAGYQPLSAGPGESLRYLILPAITLGFPQAALLARMTRSVMLDTLREDYVRTARSKGLQEQRVVLLHALRNALIPLATVLGLIVAVLLGGAVVTEQVFNIPGVGRLLVQAVGRRDYPLVQGVVLVIAGVYVLVNLCVDLAYGVLDPRVRYR
ncbi:MAG TPA: ABC transporter permease [Chloroflexota bacterium]|jgi:peptide/nickel transport system permease protein|nr:ABC transporter permease [Chloroflexota bacterium]